MSSPVAHNPSIYRTLLGLAALLVPAYWVVYHLTHPGAVDPLWLRLLISGLALGIAGVTYTEWGRSYFLVLYRGYLYLLTFWVLLLNIWNSFSFDYALGLFFVITVTAIGFNAGLRHIQPLARYLTFAVLIPITAIILYPDPDIDRSIYITYLIGLPVVLYPVARWRINIEDNLRSNEERFHVLTDATFEALLIMEEGQIIDCNTRAEEMFAAPSKSALVNRAIDDLMAPRDVAWVSELHDANEHDQYRARGQRTNGEVFPAEVHAQPMPYHGRIVRVAAIRDLTEQVRREEQLREAKNEAEEMNRLKSAFLANMSHEIRTPLTSILGFAEILDEEVPDDAGEFVQLIQRSGQRLLNTLDSVLNLAQLEAESLTLEPVRFNVASQISDTVELFLRSSEEKGIELQTRIPSDPVEVELDAKALDRIVSNLVSNAIKFTEEGFVRITLRDEEEHIVLQVQDTGKGIDTAFMDRLFDAFKQESSGLTRAHEGTGLGLTITRQLVTLMEGTIDVASTAGEGSTFTVRLPRSLTREPVAELPAG